MNSIDIWLAFIEGLALIVSPCILPVLPLVLATSIEGGRARPFGIILGFVLAFTGFALLARQLVNAFAIDLDVIKYVSLVLLALFGLVLLSRTLSEKFSAATQRFANLGGALSTNTYSGFGSGILIGLLIGLVWTPCAGPILAAVLVQVIRQQSNVEALPVLAAFALGAGVPMLLIALTGRSLVQRMSFFVKHADAVRKTFGVLILLAVAFIATGIEPQTLFGKSQDTEKIEISPQALKKALAHPYSAPEFTGIEAWLNSKPLTMKELKGKVVLVDFWTYSCINCVRTLPYITRWDETYRDKGLVIVGVHAPEFEFEKKRENVEAAIKKYNINYPVALDNRLDSWTAFSNRYWPAHYLISREGKVVYTHFGEGEYAQTENNIRFLLGLNQTADTPEEHETYADGQTPETYLGYARTKSFASLEGIARDKAQNYTLPSKLPPNSWALGGQWKIERERSITEENGATLRLNFASQKVFLVLGSRSGAPVKLSLKLNGQPPDGSAGKDAPDGMLTVSQHTLYELINQKKMKDGVLEIVAQSPGLEAYAFTFGQ